MKLLLISISLLSLLYSDIIDLNEEPLQPIFKPQNLNIDKVQLGKKLFTDTRFSKDNTISCSSCHDINFSGADNQAKSFGVDKKKGLVNTPTVFNSSLNFVQFWDGRARNLTEQIDGPIHNEIEMSTTWNEIINKLNKDNEYKKLIKKIYKEDINEENLKDSLVEFEKSLITPSRFDRYLMGHETMLSNEEKQGYTLFKDYGCASCHQGQNVGGNIYEKLGVYKPYSFPENENYYGRYNITQDLEQKHEFKVPSLRNVYNTYPYFHNGMVETLEEAIDIMGEYQLGMKISKEDILKIKAFLKSLTAEELEKN